MAGQGLLVLPLEVPRSNPLTVTLIIIVKTTRNM